MKFPPSNKLQPTVKKQFTQTGVSRLGKALRHCMNPLAYDQLSYTFTMPRLTLQQTPELGFWWQYVIYLFQFSDLLVGQRYIVVLRWDELHQFFYPRHNMV